MSGTCCSRTVRTWPWHGRERPVPGQMTGRQRLRVLVVDDDARVRGALRRLLEDVTEFECLAVDSDQASRLVTWSSTVPDVAVVDLPSTPGAGTVLVERLASLLPVVVLSMSGVTRVAALAAGAFRFVEKDGDVGALVAAIRSAVRGSGVLGAGAGPGRAGPGRE